MGDEIKEGCGVFIVKLKDESKNSSKVPRFLHIGAQALQNRGQNGFGMGVYRITDGPSFETLKHPGTVYEALGQIDGNKAIEVYDNFKGISGMSHNRYGTSGGRNSIRLVQPIHRRHGRVSKKFYMGYNGQLANEKELAKEIVDRGYKLELGVDTELIMHLVSLELKLLHDEGRGRDFTELGKRTFSQLDGGYSLAFLFGTGDLYFFRGKHGIRPGFVGEDDEKMAAASESIALERIGIPSRHIRRIPQGHIASLNNGHISLEKIFDGPDAHCFFEGIYFSNVVSLFETKPICQIRDQAGVELALSEDPKMRKYFLDNHDDVLVIDSPDTAIEAAIAFARTLGLNYCRGLRKDHSPAAPKKNFISDPESRARAIEQKFQGIWPSLYNKIVIIVEDTIVRGNTLDALLEKIYTYGRPKEIHVRVTAPPIISPCFYGIDMSTCGEFVANEFPEALSIQEREENLATTRFSVKSLRYQTHAGLDSAFGPEFNGRLCKACLTGEYPTDFGYIRVKEARDEWEAKKQYKQFSCLGEI